MSSLRDRLKRLTSQPLQQTREAEHASNDDPADQTWAKLGAVVEHNGYGTFIRRVTRYDFDSKHGYYELGRLQAEASALSPLDPKGTTVQGHRLLFFDTETTGLGIGAGNVPFLFGSGYFTEDAFIIEQCLMRNPGEEPAILAHFNKLVGRFSHLISYNGRTFDWPIVKNRYVLNRMALEDEHLTQLDFLYPARGLWKHVLVSCSLGRVEEERLGIVRHEDVPGSLAPTYYFQYLSEKDPTLLAGVFKHNEIDVLTLAVLAAHFSDVLQGRMQLQEMGAEEVLRLGFWLDKVGKSALAERVFEELLSRPTSSIRQQLLPLAAAYKRKGRYDIAARLWHAAVSSERDGVSHPISTAASIMQPLEPYIELAMYYEHRMKQIDTALIYAEKAKQLTLKRLSLHRGRQKTDKDRDLLAALDKRIGRLKSKQAALNQDTISEFSGLDLFSWTNS